MQTMGNGAECFPQLDSLARGNQTEHSLLFLRSYARSPLCGAGNHTLKKDESKLEEVLRRASKHDERCENI